MAREPMVYVVDDDTRVLDSVCSLVAETSLPVRGFSNPRHFLASVHDEMRGCIVLDLRMPVMDGLQLLRSLLDRHMDLPVLLVTAYGDVPTTAEAMQCGAYYVLEKPYEPAELLDWIQRAVDADRDRYEARVAQRQAVVLYEALTRREREVFALTVQGCLVPQICDLLKITTRTAHIHRFNLMKKIDAKCVTDIIHLAYRLPVRYHEECLHPELRPKPNSPRSKRNSATVDKSSFKPRTSFGTPDRPTATGDSVHRRLQRTAARLS